MSCVTFGPFTLDTPNATLTSDGTRVDLTPKAFDLLALLAGRPGQLVTKDEILDTVWGRRFVSESVVKTVVSELRAALSETVWHTGCTSWYVDEQGNDPSQWPWLWSDYRKRTERIEPGAYSLRA